MDCMAGSSDRAKTWTNYESLRTGFRNTVINHSAPSSISLLGGQQGKLGTTGPRVMEASRLSATQKPILDQQQGVAKMFK